MKHLLRASLLLALFAALCVPGPARAQSVTILHSFGDGSVTDDGAFPEASLIEGSDGNLYGTTYNGGPWGSGDGTVFKMPLSGSSATLHSFGYGNVTNDGTNPQAGLVKDMNPNSPTYGDFFGTTRYGGSTVSSDPNHQGYGTVYTITSAGAVTILHNFGDGSVTNDGKWPQAPLVQDLNPNSPTYGDFFGTTHNGGVTGVPPGGEPDGSGTVFMITPAGQVTILHSFDDGSVVGDGKNPEAGLVEGADGNFYGTTSLGGSFNHSTVYTGNGSVFRISPSGSLTILHRFNDGSVPNDGIEPQAGLVQGPDGNFYGTTYVGGAPVTEDTNGTEITYTFGTVFEMTPTGSVTILHSFGQPSMTYDGQYPVAGLAFGPDGNLYGTTESSGTGTGQLSLSSGDGSLFEITPSGSYTLLHLFSAGFAIDGAMPEAGLTLADDGNFYGTTYAGGSAGYGTVFSLAMPPFITSLVPNPVSAGGSSYTLTVAGGFFNPGATVNFNNAALQTTWVSSTQLSTSVPASDIGSAGTAQVTITNPNGNVSSAATLVINNPAPTLTSISPASAIEGGPQFILTVTGTGFTPSSVVDWTTAQGATSLATSYQSATTLTATVPAGLIAHSGNPKVTVANPTPGGGVSNVKTFAILVVALNLSVVSSSRDSSGNIDVTIALTNAGVKRAPAVEIKKTTLAATSALTALPMPLGTITPGGSANTTLVFPGTIAKKGAKRQLAVSGSYTGGTFSDSLSITLP